MGGGQNININRSLEEVDSDSIACYRETFRERKSQSILQTSLLYRFKELPQQPPAFSNHQPDQSAAINIEARPSISKNITTL
jgi:hypothetical protein